jgi:hypothetical protein
MALLARAAAGLLLVVSVAFTAHAQEMEVPVAMQLPLFLKVMSFDRQLRARTPGGLVLAIAYQSGSRASSQAKEDALRSIVGIRDVAGIPLRTVNIDLDREELGAALTSSGATLLYVAPVHGVDIGDLVRATRAAHVTTLTGVTRYVELGCAVGLRLRGDRPSIVVNLAAARLEGAEFTSELLRLAQVL